MRITLDLDEPRGYDIVRAWYGLAQYGEPRGRISKSGTGIHMKVHGTDFSRRACLRVRATLGDDPKRLYYDECIRNKPFQILFTRGAGRWMGSLKELIHEFKM